MPTSNRRDCAPRKLPAGFKIRRFRFRSFAESLASGKRSGPLAADYELARRAGEAIMPVVKAYRLSLDFSSGGRCRIENGSTLILNAANAAQHNRLANLKTKLLGAVVAKGLPIFDLEIRVRPLKGLPARSAAPKPAHRLRSVTGARALREEAARTADPTLQATLLSLAQAVAPNEAERPEALLRGFRLELDRAQAGAQAAAALEPALPNAPAESLVPSEADAAANPILAALRQKMLSKRALREQLETPLVAAAAALERETDEAAGILSAYFGASAHPSSDAERPDAADPAPGGLQADEASAASCLPAFDARELAALEEGLVSLHGRITAALARMADAAKAIHAAEAAQKQQKIEEEKLRAAELKGGESQPGSAERPVQPAEAQPAPDAPDAPEAKLADAEAHIARAREALLALLAQSESVRRRAAKQLEGDDDALGPQRLERFMPLADAASALHTTVRRRLDDADGLRRLLSEQQQRAAALRARMARIDAESPAALQTRDGFAAAGRAAAALSQQGEQIAEEAETLSDQLAVMEMRLTEAEEAPAGHAASASEPRAPAACGRNVQSGRTAPEGGEQTTHAEDAAADSRRQERLAAELARFRQILSLIPPSIDAKLIPDELDASQNPERMALRLRLLARWDAHRRLDDLAAAASSLLAAADASRHAGAPIDPALLEDAAGAVDALEEALAETASRLHAGTEGEMKAKAGSLPAQAPDCAASSSPEAASPDSSDGYAADNAAEEAAPTLEGADRAAQECLARELQALASRLQALHDELPRAPDPKLIPPEADCSSTPHGRRLAEARSRMLARLERRRALEGALGTLEKECASLSAALADASSAGRAQSLSSAADSLIAQADALEGLIRRGSSQDSRPQADRHAAMSSSDSPRRLGQKSTGHCLA